jgi:hypothetical protein
MRSKHVRLIYKSCKCYNINTLEYSALVGQIFYFANNHAWYEQYKIKQLCLFTCDTCYTVLEFSSNGT